MRMIMMLMLVVVVFVVVVVVVVVRCELQMKGTLSCVFRTVSMIHFHGSVEGCVSMTLQPGYSLWVCQF